MRTVCSRFRLSTLFDFASLSFFIQFSRFLVVCSRFRFGKLPEDSSNPPACCTRFHFGKLPEDSSNPPACRSRFRFGKLDSCTRFRAISLSLVCGCWEENEDQIRRISMPSGFASFSGRNLCCAAARIPTVVGSMCPEST